MILGNLPGIVHGLIVQRFARPGGVMKGAHLPIGVFARHQLVHHPQGGPPLDVDGDAAVGILLQKGGDGGSQPHPAHVVHTADVQMPAVGEPLDGGHHLVIVGQQLSGVGLELPACGRQRHHPAAAVKQTDVQLILQLADLLGQGGLGAGDLKGGLCKAPLIHHIDKAFQLKQVHLTSIPCADCRDMPYDTMGGGERQREFPKIPGSMIPNWKIKIPKQNDMLFWNGICLENRIRFRFGNMTFQSEIAFCPEFWLK